MALPRGQEPQINVLRRLIADCDDQKCVEWQFARARRGYGAMWHNNRSAKAHRVAYELAYGAAPDDQVVRHKCDNPPCVNPHDLQIGSIADNVRDRVERNRGRFGSSHPKSKLSPAQVLEIRDSTEASSEIAGRMGVTPQAINAIRKGLVWRRMEA